MRLILRIFFTRLVIFLHQDKYKRPYIRSFKNETNIIMSRLSNSIQRISRGSSRGINYYNAMKNSNPTYGSSIKKTPPEKVELLRNQAALKGSLREKNSNAYDYTFDRLKDKPRAVVNDGDLLRSENKQKNQHFRIRTNTNAREKQLANSRKAEEDRVQEEMADMKKREVERQSEKKVTVSKVLEPVTFKQQTVAQSGIRRQDKKSVGSLSTGISESVGQNKYGYSTSKTIGLVGLNNIGNTCFMNSILQCMFNLPDFNEYFISNRYEKEAKSSSRVAEAYAETIKRMRTSTARSETPSELKSAIGSKKSRFMGYSQQDAQQFLAALMELLSLDLNRSKNPKYKELKADLSTHSLKQISDEWWLYNKQREDSIVCDFFSGQILSRVVCSSCKNESIAFDNIWDMALDFGQSNGEILKMISNFLKQEIISEDYYCAKCKDFKTCKRKVDFYRLPKVLVLQLKRFSYGKWRKVKLNNRVKVPVKLDLSDLITESKHESVKDPVYDLVGVVNHSGDIDFGHYTAECRNPINGKWYNFNDSSVHETRISEELDSSSPYVLFYAKASY